MNRPEPVPDPDAEREVDLRSVWERIAARWWLPVLGLVLGAVVGFALALGGGKVYEAETLVAMGQPFSPNGGAPVQAFLTNPRAVSEIIRSESALRRRRERAPGLPVRALRGNVSSAIVGASGPGARDRLERRSSRSRSIAAQPRQGGEGRGRAREGSDRTHVGPVRRNEDQRPSTSSSNRSRSS